MHVNFCLSHIAHIKIPKKNQDFPSVTHQFKPQKNDVLKQLFQPVKNYPSLHGYNFTFCFKRKILLYGKHFKSLVYLKMPRPMLGLLVLLCNTALALKHRGPSLFFKGPNKLN